MTLWRRWAALLAVLMAALGGFGLAATNAVATPTATVIATIQLPRNSYTLSTGLGSLWALQSNEMSYSNMYRIDPRTNTVAATVSVGFPAAGLAVAYGSVWVSDYYASKLYRLSPAGNVQAIIPTGLQPQTVHVAFGSVWTSNHHGHSLSRIDPSTNGVLATINVGARVFRNGPQDFVSDGRYLYVESSNLPYLQRVDPATEAVTNLTTTGYGYGGNLVWTPGPTGGTLWNQPYDPATGQIVMDGYDVLGTVRVRVPVSADRTPNAIAALSGSIYFGENPSAGSSRGLIRQIDQVTGAPGATIVVSGQVGALSAGFGDLWEADLSNGTVRRFLVATSVG